MANKQIFSCKGKVKDEQDKESPCPEKVVYDEEDDDDLDHLVEGLDLVKKDKRKITVYLTCDLGHTFPYKVDAATDTE